MINPCMSICTYVDGKCIGCYRTMEEIENWFEYSDEERKKIMERLDDEINFD